MNTSCIYLKTIYKLIIVIVLVSFFLTLVVTGGFHWKNPSDSKSSQIWKYSCLSHSCCGQESLDFFLGSWGFFLSAPTIIGITFTFIFYNFLYFGINWLKFSHSGRILVTQIFIIIILLDIGYTNFLLVQMIHEKLKGENLIIWILLFYILYHLQLHWLIQLEGVNLLIISSICLYHNYVNTSDN